MAMKTRITALVVLALVLGSTAGSAYKLNGPKWPTQQVPYYVNPVNGDMSGADAIASIQAGANVWSAQSNADILPYYMGTTTGSSLTKNGKNEVFFRDGSNGSLYAETYWWYNSRNELVDADIVFYDATYTFFSGSTGCSSGVYLVDAAAHEFGHVLGLGHSSLKAATMYPSMSKCSSSLRILDADDLAGIEALYPPGGTNTAPTVTISSPSNGTTFAEGTAISFSGSASDKEDGNLSASLVWVSSRDGQIGTGASFSKVLSTGSHTITARVSDSQGATGEAQRSVTVEAAPAPPTEGITLSGKGYKVKGDQKADLSWTGASSTSVEIFRNGARVALTSNTGSYTDHINRKGGGSYRYIVCEAGTSTCSNEVVVSY
jgi:hypothetical protein